ncbi:oligosaccharide repeat unit polymerase [Arthrobacter sp. VKM Ac-2550]|nr:oligosaccharide repeat unit polymerase [Arthrobacter sp. VKM Ac-2550]
MITTGVASIAIGAIIGWVVPFVSASPTKPLPKIDLIRVARVHWLSNGILVFYSLLQVLDAWPVIQQLGGLSAVFSPSGLLGNEFKHQYDQYRVEVVQEGFSTGSIVTGILGYVLFLGHFSIYTGAVLWSAGKRLAAVVPLLISASYSLLSLQRTSFVMCVLLFVIAAYFIGRHYKILNGRPSNTTTRKRPKKSRIAVIVGGVMCLPVLLVPLQLRNASSNNSTGFQSLMEYLIASVAGLNARMGSGFSLSTPPAEVIGEVAPYPGYGSYTFTGLSGLLNRLGLPVPIAPHSLDYMSVKIYGHEFTTNTGTSFLDFYLDFGWAGVVALSMILGFLASLAIRNVTRGNLGWIPAASFLVTTLVWSFFVNALLGDFRYIYFTFLSIYLLPKILYSRRNPRGDVQYFGLSNQR